MGVNVLRGFLLGSFFAASSISFSQPSTDEPARVEILVERIERVSRDEVHFWLKVSNRSDEPVFLTGINYELLTKINYKSGPRLYPVYIEQWRLKEGWKRTCGMDTPPPHVIKLNRGDAITEVLWEKLPMSLVCRNRITRWEGKFRFGLEYFDSEKQARIYVKKIFSRRWKEARAQVAFSEAFEIPPTPNP